MERTLTRTGIRSTRAFGRAVATVVIAAVLGAGDAASQAETSRARPPAAPPTGQSSSGDLVLPFTVGPARCADRSRQYNVTMRIYNVLAQPVAIPMLATDAGAAAGPVLSRLMLPCGRYAAIWNGRHVNTGRRLAPGVYLIELVIDGQRLTRKVTLPP